jgi:hypothetical protein
MNSALQVAKAEPFSHFQLQLRVRERAIKKGFLWDREYPDKTIYSVDVEVRVGDFDDKAGTDVQFRWLAEGGDWKNAEESDAGFRIPLRAAGSLGGNLLILGSKWPDEGCEDVIPSSRTDKTLKKLKSGKDSAKVIKKRAPK